MGIAIAIIVVPVFFVVVGLSISLAIRSNRWTTAQPTVGRSIALKAIGFLGAVVLTLLATWAVPADNNFGWHELFAQIAVVVLGPLVIGATLLILGLIARNARPMFMSIATGAFVASIVTPIVVPVAFWHYQSYQDRSAYDPLCKNAFIEIVERVSPARSVVFLPDSFVSPAEREQSYRNSWAEFVLNQSLLEYVERPATEKSGPGGKAQFERVSTSGKRILSSHNSSERTTFIYEPVDSITAEYVVHAESLLVEHSKTFGLGGERIEIYRRADNKLVARAQYYWSNKLFRSCPEETRGGLFVYHFIAEALNVKNPEGPQRAVRFSGGD